MLAAPQGGGTHSCLIPGDSGGPSSPLSPSPQGDLPLPWRSESPQVGTLDAGMLDFLTWCSSAGGLRAGRHSSFRKEDGGRVCFPPPPSSDRNQLVSTPTTPTGPITVLEPLAA